MHEILKLDFFDETSPGASARSEKRAHKKIELNRSSRSKNIDIPTGYSRGAQIHAAPALAPPPHLWPRLLHPRHYCS